MDRVVEVLIEEVALEGLDGITLETLWMRLATRDQPFPLALDEYSKPVIWQQIAQSNEVEFFELPEPRGMPILRDTLKDGPQTWYGATCMAPATERKLITTVYPVAYVEDKEKGIKGSCATYSTRQNVTKEVIDEEGNVKMSLTEAENRWENKLVMVASQDARWKVLVGLHGDPQIELGDKQYMMLEAVCRGRQLGEYQCVLSKRMGLESRNMFYHRIVLSKQGFIKKRHAIYQVGDQPQKRSVILFGTMFKENVVQPMYETLWEGMSDLLEKRPNRMWTLQALRVALRERFPDMPISDKTFKRVLAAAKTSKMIDKMKTTHQVVFNEKKIAKHTDADTMVIGVKLLKTFEEYLNEENLEEEEEEEKRDTVFLRDPTENQRVAERNLKSLMINVIEEKQEQGELMSKRGIHHAVMTDYYVIRFVLKRFIDDKILKQVMKDEGRQRTTYYRIADSTERKQTTPKKNQTPEKGTSGHGFQGEDVPSTSSSPLGESEQAVAIKQEYPGTSPTPKKSSYLRNTEVTANQQRRRQFILDYMHTNRVVEYVFPIIKAIRAEEKEMGIKITCDSKTIKRLVAKLCKENLLQTISTVVMSDDGLHTKTVTLVTEFGIKPTDTEVTSALQVARFRFFGSLASMKRKRGTKPPPPKKPVTVENAGASKAKPAAEKHKESKSPPKKKKKADKEKTHSHHKKAKKAKHKHKDKDEKEVESLQVETISSDEDDESSSYTPRNAPYQSRKYYFRQLGYQPKMLRMRVAHMFMWHMVYGRFGLPVKRETLKDIEAVQLAADNMKLDENSEKIDDLPPIPIKIRKAGDELLEDSLKTSMDGTEDNTQQAANTINQSEVSNNEATESNSGTTTPPDTHEDILIIDDEPKESAGIGTGIHNMKFTVYSNTYDWRRYVPPFPVDPKRPAGWCVIRDLLLAMPVSIFLKIVSLPIEVKGIKEYLNHPLKKHILMRHLPIGIRRQLLRGRTYLFSIQNVLILLASIGLVVLTNINNINKDQLSVFICKKASILDTTTSKPAPKKINDKQRYMRRFYQLNSLKDVEDYWFDLQCICLDTPLGMSMKGKNQVGKKVYPDQRYESHIKSIAQIASDMSQPIIDDGIPPGDGRGACGLDSSIFSHLRRNWNWYNSVPEVHYDRYLASYPNDNIEEMDRSHRKNAKKKLKRLGSIQYRRNNMSQGTTVEVVSVTRQERKEMQATVGNIKAKKFEGKETPLTKTKKQIAKEQTKEVKDQAEDAKKKDDEILDDRRRKFRMAFTNDGKRNTTTYDDKDEEARKLMSKMRVDWTPEEDTLILLCRVASTILNTKAIKMGAFVPWFVIRDVMHKNIERSKDKTTKSLAKRSHHIMKNPSTYLNFKICLAEAQTDKELLALSTKHTEDYSKMTVCAKEFEEFVQKLQEKFQSSDSTIGALTDIGELKNYIITPVHRRPLVDEKTLTNRDIKSVKDIHFKLLCSLVLSSLASRHSDLYNNQLVYKTYEQYNQDLLGSVFIHFRKMGFCNRYRKPTVAWNHKRIIPVAPISIQLSNSYKDRFVTPMPEPLVGEMHEFMAKLRAAGDSLVLPTEINGGDCAGVLSLMAADKVILDITLPDQIIKIDLNLLDEGDLTAKNLDSDSDSDEEADSGSTAKHNKPPKESQSDIEQLMSIQKQRTPVIAETIKPTQMIVEESNKPHMAAKESQSDIEQLVSIQKQRTPVIAETIKLTQKIVDESTKPSEKEPSVENDTPVVSVLSDHSYSVYHRTLPQDEIDEVATRQAKDGDEECATTSQTQRTTTNEDNNDKETVKTDTSQSDVTDMAENKPVSGSKYNIKGSQVSLSRWLVLQGHYTPSTRETLGKNIQDNTLVNACTVTLRKADDQSMETRTSDCTEQQTLLWDMFWHDDGRFKGFERCSERTRQILGKDTTCIVNTMWSDVDAMISGLSLKWRKEDLDALRTLYTCIDDTDFMGIVAETDFRQQCAALLPNASQKTIRECVHILVQEQLVLEVGFDVLRFVAAQNASPWLIHSTRLDPTSLDETFPHQTKKQRMDPPLTDDPPLAGDPPLTDPPLTDDPPLADPPVTDPPLPDPPVIDISEDQDVECMVISDDEDESNEKKKSPKSKENVSKEEAAVSEPDKEDVEIEEEVQVFGKRKRSQSPTECAGTAVTFVGRPWRSIEGYQCDSELLKYLQHVIFYIVTRPGVKEQMVFENFKDILHPVECMELLKMLKDIGCITKHKVQKMKPTSIFMTPMQADDTDRTYYYQPTAHCLATFAEVSQPKPT
ncbi:general transcription factor 3C polypeptide 1-like [Amphiura filiformis]|uniref:general transcription factor 3C polypeptide 1-like n=1 Tax=Amphiura filiformis TaxID=82378 RepID=UPI003B219B33